MTFNDAEKCPRCEGSGEYQRLPGHIIDPCSLCGGKGTMKAACESADGYTPDTFHEGMTVAEMQAEMERRLPLSKIAEEVANVNRAIKSAAEPRLFTIDFHQRGTFTGQVWTGWNAPRDYQYFSDEGFSFTRANGQTITPPDMHTDGASIPRLLWSLDNASPWDWLPAAIIHDGLFTAHHAGDDSVSFEEANLILRESIWTLVQDGTIEMSDWKIYLVGLAVDSEIGRKVWDGKVSLTEFRAMRGKA